MDQFERLDRELDERGWALVEGAYSQEVIAPIIAELDHIRSLYEEIQKEEGVLEESRNAYHHTIVTCRAQLALINPNPIHDYLEHYFGGRYILNSMGSSYIEPVGTVYTQNIHRDVRSFSGSAKLLLNTLVMLDDSTTENGATWMLEGSHKTGRKPEQKFFYDNAVRVVGKAGDLLLFDGNIWHSAGVNSTPNPRRIVTPLFSPPFIKQALDYPRAFGYDFRWTITPQLRQILGYNALTPVTLSEFYKPREKRFYKPDQG